MKNLVTFYRLYFENLVTCYRLKSLLLAIRKYISLQKLAHISDSITTLIVNHDDIASLYAKIRCKGE